MEWLVNLIPDMNGNKGVLSSKVDYEYDLLSGNVTKLSYNDGRRDEYFQKYTYDEDNRIKEVYSSRHDIVYDREAKYNYSKHAGLERTEIGDDNLQGIDYTYTIDGKLKAINDPSGTIVEASASGLVNQENYPKDAFSMLLAYHKNDFINKNTQGFQTRAFQSNVEFTELFNGNISAWEIDYHDIAYAKINNASFEHNQVFNFRYDVLQRLVSSKNMKNDFSIEFTNFSADFSYDTMSNIRAVISDYLY